LELHPTKTKVVYCQDKDRRREYPHTEFDFLGYTVSVKQPRTLFNVGINKVLHQQHFLPCYTAF